MENKENYYCRVCGLEQVDPPWGEDEKNPSFEICECCGVEFGYEDSLIQGVKKYRQEWLNKRANWHEPKYQPQDWDLKSQLTNIPEKFS